MASNAFGWRDRPDLLADKYNPALDGPRPQNSADPVDRTFNNFANGAVAITNMARGMTPKGDYGNSQTAQDAGVNDIMPFAKDDAGRSWMNSTSDHDEAEQTGLPEHDDRYNDAMDKLSYNSTDMSGNTKYDDNLRTIWDADQTGNNTGGGMDESGMAAYADGGEVEDDYSVDPMAFAQKQGLPQEQAQPQDDQGDLMSRVLDYGRKKYGLIQQGVQDAAQRLQPVGEGIRSAVQGAPAFGQRVRKEIDALPPPFPPGFADGGTVDDDELTTGSTDAPEGEPQPDVPLPPQRPMSADYGAEEQTAPFNSALEMMKAPFRALGEAAGAGGAAEAGMPPQYMGYLTGDVAHPDQVRQIEDEVKKDNPSLSPSDTKIAAIQAAFAKDPESGWQLSQNYRQKHEHSRFAGVALADQGDLKQASDLANHAFATLPNGFDYHFAPSGNDAVSVDVSQNGQKVGTKVMPAQEFREFLASKDAQYDHAIDNPTAVLQGGQDAGKAETAGKPDYVAGWASKDAGDLKERLSHVNVPELEKEQMIAKTLGEGGQKYPSEIQKEQMGNDSKMDVATATADARYKQQQMVENYKTNRAAMSDATKDKASQLRASTSLMVAAQNASSREEAEKYKTLGRMLSPSSGIPVNIDKAAQMAAAMGVDLKQALGGLGQAPTGQLPQAQAPTSVPQQQRQQPQASAPPVVNTSEDYARVPPGAQYRSKDGLLRTKPAR